MGLSPWHWIQLTENSQTTSRAGGQVLSFKVIISAGVYALSLAKNSMNFLPEQKYSKRIGPPAGRQIMRIFVLMFFCLNRDFQLYNICRIERQPNIRNEEK